MRQQPAIDGKAASIQAAGHPLQAQHTSSLDQDATVRSIRFGGPGYLSRPLQSSNAANECEFLANYYVVRFVVVGLHGEEVITNTRNDNNNNSNNNNNMQSSSPSNNYMRTTVVSVAQVDILGHCYNTRWDRRTNRRMIPQTITY